jgi:hypothetical protein
MSSQQNVITTMVSSVVQELAVAETPSDMAESKEDEDLHMMPVGASKPLISSSSV